MGTTQIEVVNKNVASLEAMLLENQERLARLLPKAIRLDQFVYVALQMVSGNSYLARCAETTEGKLSILRSCCEAAELGLMFTKHLGHGYLVPFKNGALSKPGYEVIEAQFMIGYRGFSHLITSADPNTRAPYSVIVWPGEPFQYLGPGSLPDHQISAAGGRITIDQRTGLIGLVGCYAVLPYRDGSHRVEWMTAAEIDGIRRRSKAVQSGKPGPWDTDPGEMVKKTPLRRLAKWVPLTPQITVAAARDEYRELVVDDHRALESARTVNMPQRRSPEGAAAGQKGPFVPPAASTPSPSAPNGGSGHQEPATAAPDYSQDPAPACKACGGETELKPAGGYGNKTWGPKWRCKTCAKGVKGCVTDAAEWHEQCQRAGTGAHGDAYEDDIPF